MLKEGSCDARNISGKRRLPDVVRDNTQKDLIDGRQRTLCLGLGSDTARLLVSRDRS